MSEKISTPRPHPSSETYHIPESAQKQIDAMSAEAQDIAAEHERLEGLSEIASIYDDHAQNVVPNREKLYGQLHALLEKTAKEEGRKSLAESEDLLEEYLLEFWENDQHGLSVEQKNEIIGKIIEQTRREDEARAEVEEALEIDDNPEEKEEDNLDAADEELEPVDDETKEEDPESLSSEEQEVVDQIQAEIDAIDLISNYATRLKKLSEYAKAHNGKKDPLGRDIGVMAAKRIDKSSARSILNPRRYLIRLGGARRQYNRLLSDMAKQGPQGANLDAALAMKRNWDPRYRKLVPGKNETLFEVSKIFEDQIISIPTEIDQLNKKLKHLKKDPITNVHIERHTRNLKQLTQLEKDILNGAADQEGAKKLPSIDEVREGIRQTKESLKHSIDLQKSIVDNDIQDKTEQIKALREQYRYINEASIHAEEAVDPLFAHAHKFRGEIIANRARTRKDINLLSPLEVFGHRLKMQRALSDIVITNYREGILTKPEAINLINQKIKNRKIRDYTVNSIS